MWIMLNDSFVSIVDKDCDPDELCVRARRPGDIEKLWPTARVTEYDKSDYQFRAVIKRWEVARVIADRVMDIDYRNFKDSVINRVLHDAYMRIWSVMAALQPKAPYSGLRGRKNGRSKKPVS